MEHQKDKRSKEEKSAQRAATLIKVFLGFLSITCPGFFINLQLRDQEIGFIQPGLFTGTRHAFRGVYEGEVFTVSWSVHLCFPIPHGTLYP
jgi:hypothetical protein